MDLLLLPIGVDETEPGSTITTTKSTTFEIKLPGAGTLHIGNGSSTPPSIGDPVGPSKNSLPGVVAVVVVAVVVDVVVEVYVVVGCS